MCPFVRFVLFPWAADLLSFVRVRSFQIRTVWSWNCIRLFRQLWLCPNPVRVVPLPFADGAFLAGVLQAPIESTADGILRIIRTTFGLVVLAENVANLCERNNTSSGANPRGLSGPRQACSALFAIQGRISPTRPWCGVFEPCARSVQTAASFLTQNLEFDATQSPLFAVELAKSHCGGRCANQVILIYSGQSLYRALIHERRAGRFRTPFRPIRIG